LADSGKACDREKKYRMPCVLRAGATWTGFLRAILYRARHCSATSGVKGGGRKKLVSRRVVILARRRVTHVNCPGALHRPRGKASNCPPGQTHYPSAERANLHCVVSSRDRSRAGLVVHILIEPRHRMRWKAADVLNRRM